MPKLCVFYSLRNTWILYLTPCLEQLFSCPTMKHKAGLKSTAEDTPGLLLLSVPSPHRGCSRCSVLEEETHLFMSFVYCYCLPSIQILSFNFFGFNSHFLLFLPAFLASLFSFQDCIHDWYMLLPIPSHKPRGPNYLSDSFGAVFLVSYCISVHTSVTCTSEYSVSASAFSLSPCPLTSLCGDTDGTSTVPLFLTCLCLSVGSLSFASCT